MVSMQYGLTLPGTDFDQAIDLIERLHAKAKKMPFRKVTEISMKAPAKMPVDVSPGWPARIEDGISFKVVLDGPATFGLTAFEEEIGLCHWWDAVQTKKPSVFGDLLDHAADLGIEVVQSLDGVNLRSKQTAHGIMWMMEIPK